MLRIFFLSLILFFITGCETPTNVQYYEPEPQTNVHYSPSINVYFWDGYPYFGYWGGYYYYYGYPHCYPWHYYYIYEPPWWYHRRTHVHYHHYHDGYIIRPRTGHINNHTGRNIRSTDIDEPNPTINPRPQVAPQNVQPRNERTRSYPSSETQKNIREKTPQQWVQPHDQRQQKITPSPSYTPRPPRLENVSPQPKQQRQIHKSPQPEKRSK